MEQEQERSDDLEAQREHSVDDAQNGAVRPGKGKRIYVGYTLKTASNQIYVGRTSGIGTPEEIVAKRFAHHHQKQYNDLWEGEWVGSPEVQVVTSDYAAIRGWDCHPSRGWAIPIRRFRSERAIGDRLATYGPQRPAQTGEV